MKEQSRDYYVETKCPIDCRAKQGYTPMFFMALCEEGPSYDLSNEGIYLFAQKLVCFYCNIDGPRIHIGLYR